jgi:hypothetical protein
MEPDRATLEELLLALCLLEAANIWHVLEFLEEFPGHCIIGPHLRLGLAVTIHHHTHLNTTECGELTSLFLPGTGSVSCTLHAE